LISLHLKSFNKHRWVNTEGELNHLNGFALRRWNEDGQLLSEEYRIDGKQHNTKGPAFRRWHYNGELLDEKYWLEGKKVDKSTFEKSY